MSKNDLVISTVLKRSQRGGPLRGLGGEWSHMRHRGLTGQARMLNLPGQQVSHCQQTLSQSLAALCLFLLPSACTTIILFLGLYTLPSCRIFFSALV